MIQVKTDNLSVMSFNMSWTLEKWIYLSEHVNHWLEAKKRFKLNHFSLHKNLWNCGEGGRGKSWRKNRKCHNQVNHYELGIIIITIYSQLIERWWGDNKVFETLDGEGSMGNN